MNSPLAVWLLLFLILLNAVLAAARAALVNTRKPRLAQMREEGRAGAALAERIALDASRLIATVRLGQMLCRFFAAGLGAVLLIPPASAWLSNWRPVAAFSTAIAAAGVILFGALIVMLTELVAEALALRNAEAWAVRCAPLVAGLEWLAAPVVRALAAVTGLFAGSLSGRAIPVVTEEEIKTLVDAGEEGGLIEEEEKEMIYSIFRLGDTLAREVMVPRIDMFALEADTPFAEAVKAVIAVGHSRVPVYQGSIDNVVGLLHAKDMLRAWQDGVEGQRLRDALRPAYFVPEAKKIGDLLEELQSRRIHMAVVVDEYGGVAGLVTLEDIVEEIVGEIRDEFDAAEEPAYTRVGEGEYLFDARIDLDDVNELLEAELPKESGETLGGFLYGQLGKVPAAGEQVQAGGLAFEVVSVAGRRIRKVHVRRLPPESPPAV